MDLSDETPERFWVANPKQHGLDPNCSCCRAALDFNGAIPVLTEKGPLCLPCAVEDVKDIHPLTVTYLTWMEQKDPRWWSVWICHLECCFTE